MNRQTTLAKPGSVERGWRLLDATDRPLGRLASEVAMILMGKDKPIYTPHVDTGDGVVIINAEKVKLTGRKGQNKVHKVYTGYPGGLKTFTYDWMIDNKPEVLIERAVRRMLPKNTLGRHMHKKLKVYKGAEHPHQAQQPVAVAG